MSDKVELAVEAFEQLDSAQDEFNEAFSELSEEDIKEFEKVTGATVGKKHDDPEQEIKRLQKEIKALRHGIEVALTHTVAYQFVEMYKERLDPEQKEEWVPAVYVKEITAYAAINHKEPTEAKP